MNERQENQTTAQRLKEHLDKKAKEYYAPIQQETKTNVQEHLKKIRETLLNIKDGK